MSPTSVTSSHLIHEGPVPPCVLVPCAVDKRLGEKAHLATVCFPQPQGLEAEAVGCVRALPLQLEKSGEPEAWGRWAQKSPDTPGSPEGNTEGPGTASSEPLLPS